MVGGGCRPEAETVMVLHHGNAALHTSRLCCLEPLHGIGHLGGRKRRLALKTATPLFSRVGVHAVMEESIKFGFVPLHLALTRNGENGKRCVVGIVKRFLDNWPCACEVAGIMAAIHKAESNTVIFFIALALVDIYNVNLDIQ